MVILYQRFGTMYRSHLLDHYKSNLYYREMSFSALCLWVIITRRFEEAWRIYLQWSSSPRRIAKSNSVITSWKGLNTLCHCKLVLRRVKEERNILHTIKRMKANWIGHILRRNCLLKHVIEWKIEEGYTWREDEEEDISSYWMTLRKREDTGNWKRTHRWYSVWKSLWKRLPTCRATDCRWNEWMNE
jgi:hypothetical protein